MVTRKKAATVKVPVESVRDEVSEVPLVSRAKSLVFISHDSRDAAIAEAFANLLIDVSAGTLKSFRSSDKKSGTGIEFGAEWYTAIMSQLGDATDVVALLTPRSIDRPWILYEAGVAKGKLGTTVLGLALGVPLEHVSTGPFGQFQNCGDDEDSLTKLVLQLLQKNPDAAPREEAVRRQVKLFIAALTQILDVKPEKSNVAVEAHEEQSVAKLFEEVKAMVRELPDRVDSRVRLVTRRHPGKLERRFHPEMFDEILFMSEKYSDMRGNPTGLLLILSVIRDDAAWLYELGMDLYRAMASGNSAATKAAYKRFRELLKITQKFPLPFETGDEMEKTIHFAARAIDQFAMRYIESMPSRRGIDEILKDKGRGPTL